VNVFICVVSFFFLLFAIHSRKSDAKFPEILKWLNFQSAFAKATARQAVGAADDEKLQVAAAPTTGRVQGELRIF